MIKHTPATTALLDAAMAAIAYDKAISSCANDPKKMSSFCTAQGDDLDDLYFRWLNLTGVAINMAKNELKEIENA